MSEDRGTGQTSRQMTSAPTGSLYVCPNSGWARVYGKRLAKHLRRDDIRFAAPNELYIFRGLDLPAIIIDHAAVLTDARWKEVRGLEAYCGRRVA